MPGSGGIDYPGDVHKLLGDLYLATGRLPQLLDQVAAFLLAQAYRGRLGDDNGRSGAGRRPRGDEARSRARPRLRPDIKPSGRAERDRQPARSRWQ